MISDSSDLRCDIVIIVQFKHSIWNRFCGKTNDTSCKTKGLGKKTILADWKYFTQTSKWGLEKQFAKVD